MVPQAMGGAHRDAASRRFARSSATGAAEGKGSSDGRGAAARRESPGSRAAAPQALRRGKVQATGEVSGTPRVARFARSSATGAAEGKGSSDGREAAACGALPQTRPVSSEPAQTCGGQPLSGPARNAGRILSSRQGDMALGCGHPPQRRRSLGGRSASRASGSWTRSIEQYEPGRRMPARVQQLEDGVCPESGQIGKQI
jgi:hypothetical protein